MNKNLIFIICFAFILFLIIDINFSFAQDIYHDGNFSNGENISLFADKYLFVKGENINILEKNPRPATQDNEHFYVSLTIRVDSFIFIKTDCLNTEYQIKTNDTISLFLEYANESEENLRFTDPISSIELQNYKNLKVSVLPEKIEVLDGVKLIFLLQPKLDLELWIKGDGIDRLTFDEDVAGKLDKIYGIFGKKGYFWRTIEENYLGDVQCPDARFTDFGFIEGMDNSISIASRGEVGIFGINILLSAKPTFTLTKIDEISGCQIQIDSKKYKPTTDLKNNLLPSGNVFLFHNGLKIIDGKVSYAETEISGKNIFFFKNNDENEYFNENKDKFPKDLNAIFYNDKTGTYILTPNFTGEITIQGQKTTYKKGKVLGVGFNQLNFYQIQNIQEEEYLSAQDNIDRAKTLTKDATCEEFGGEWKDEREGCHTNPNTWLGQKTNEWSGAKITDYSPGKTCCFKQTIKKKTKINFMPTNDQQDNIQIEENDVGSVIFKSANKGSIVIDVAPQILNEQVAVVKKEVFSSTSQSSIPKIIKTTDLSEHAPDFGGVYNKDSGRVEINRALLQQQGLVISTKEVVVHEILHHFFTLGNKKQQIEDAMKKYLKDESLNSEQVQARKKLLFKLDEWSYGYNLKDPNSQDYFEQITCNEGYSVIGQWLYRSNTKFPSYVLDLYQGILKPEIINQGR
jgi:hypothetical protein